MDIVTRHFVVDTQLHIKVEGRNTCVVYVVFKIVYINNSKISRCQCIFAICCMYITTWVLIANSTGGWSRTKHEWYLKVGSRIL